MHYFFPLIFLTLTKCNFKKHLIYIFKWHFRLLSIRLVWQNPVSQGLTVKRFPFQSHDPEVSGLRNTYQSTFRILKKVER